MKNKFFIILMLFLFALSSYGKLSADITAIDTRIYPDEQAAYKLVLSNGDDHEKFVRIYTPDIRWYINTDPYISKIGSQDILTSTLLLIPTAWAGSGTQIVKVIIESPNSNEEIEKEITVSVKSFDEEPKVYPASLELKVKVPEEFDPRASSPIEVYVRNRNKLNITNLKIIVKSKLFAEERQLKLEPLSESSEKFLIKLDKLTLPQSDSVVVGVFVDGKEINNERINYNVLQYTEFSPKEDIISELFKTTVNYEVTNEGNIQNKDKFKVDIMFLESPFISSSPPPSRIDLKKRTIEWDLDLAPGEVYRIEVEKNFRPAIYIMLIIIFATIMYFMYRSPVLVKKESFLVGPSKEGISEMKILIHVRNRSSEMVEKLTLSDQIPAIATIIEEVKIGVLAPSKIIHHQKKGSVIRWDFESLDPFEERILTYRMKSKMTILGGFNLPVARMKFKTKRGTERTVRSNKSFVSFGL